MAIDFRFQAVRLRAFRGIRALDLELPEGATAVLIGANNAGKSTILDAVSLALSGPASYNFSPVEYDFFHDAAGEVSDEFEITVSFVADSEVELPAVRGGYGDPVAVHAVRVTGSTEKNNRYSHDTRLIDSEGAPISLPVSLPLKGKAKEAWREHGLAFRMRNARWSDINDQRPDVWLLRPDNLFPSLYTWKTGPLKRLASLLAERFFSSKWTFEYEKKSRPMPDSLQHVHRFFAEAIREFPFWRNDLKPKLQDTLSQYVGRQARFELKPSIHAIEDWLAEHLALSFAADTGGAITPLDRMGHGWQSLVRIAALDVLSQYPSETQRRVVLLFEEPESFLHPHLVRKLRGVLDRLAASGWTVIVTTHSANMVSFAAKQAIVRLTRKGEDVSGPTLHTADIEGAAKFQERLDERGAHEMLFAQKAVLCEGQDDVFAVRSFLEKRIGLDLDGGSVSIVRTGDVGQLPAFAAMATKLGIPWCAVCDEDRLRDGTIKPASQKVRDRITKMQSSSDHHVLWSVDLEACLGKPSGKAEPSWQASNIEPKEMPQLKSDHPDYVKSCEEIRAWVTK